MLSSEIKKKKKKKNMKQSRNSDIERIKCIFKNKKEFKNEPKR